MSSEGDLPVMGWYTRVLSQKYPGVSNISSGKRGSSLYDFLIYTAMSDVDHPVERRDAKPWNKSDHYPLRPWGSNPTAPSGPSHNSLVMRLTGCHVEGLALGRMAGSLRNTTGKPSGIPATLLRMVPLATRPSAFERGKRS